MNRRTFLKFAPILPAVPKGVKAFSCLSPPQGQAGPNGIRILETPGGVRFGVLGPKPVRPASTLFIFSSTLEASLGSETYARVGWNLARQGFISVSLDLPCHGEDRRSREPENGLACWRVRLEKGENFLPGFLGQLSAVLDFLIHEGYTNPEKIAVCGTSRGGFVALHFAAVDRRVRCVAAFSPVTNLLTLREFAGMEKDKLTGALGLLDHAEKLATRPIWLCIGNDDRRVGTYCAISFAQRVMEAAAAQERSPCIELHVGKSEGHHTPANAHEEAAKWILGQVAE